MNANVETVQTTAPLTDSEDDHNHIWCCDDQNTAMCGVDLTGARVIGEDEEIDCGDCARLEAADAEWIGSDLDDGFTRCPHCPLNVLRGSP